MCKMRPYRPVLRPGQHYAAGQRRARDEEVQLGEVIGRCHVCHPGLGLRVGGVEHQHINRAETARDRGDQLSSLLSWSPTSDLQATTTAWP
jgi:hypothetical protein